MRISTDVLSQLSLAVATERDIRLVEQMDRALYTKVNKILEAAGGKWNKKEKVHVFPNNNAIARLEQMLTTEQIEIPKDEFNFFPTPKPIVDIMLQKAGIEKGMSVLEPSAGQGAIAVPARDLGAFVVCYDLLPDNYEKLIEIGGFGEVHLANFLGIVPGKGKFDRVLMNPPFSAQRDLLHVRHAFDFLLPGGILVAVVGAGVSFRLNRLTMDFRAWVKSLNGNIVPLPEGSFKESGTMVNTCLLFLKKPNDAIDQSN